MSARRACPSFLINNSVLFDIGPGSLRNLRISNVDSNNIHSLFISHLQKQALVAAVAVLLNCSPDIPKGRPLSGQRHRA